MSRIVVVIYEKRLRSRNIFFNDIWPINLINVACMQVFLTFHIKEAHKFLKIIL